MDIKLKKLELDNGETLGYRESSSGEKNLLLIHGNMTSSKHWDLLMENLPDDYKVYAIDLRGFGISTYNKEINSIKDFSEDVKLFVDKIGLEKFTVAGWSTGGGVAMQFSADYPEYVENLILLESVGVSGYPIFKKDEQGNPIIGEILKTKEEVAMDPIQVMPILNAYKNKDKETLKQIWEMTIYTHNKPNDSRYDDYLEDMLTQRNLVDVDYALLTFNISNKHNGVVEGNNLAEKIQVPTLIIQGDRDYVVPMEMAKGIKDAIGDNAVLKVIENSGHSPLIDNLDELIDSIIDFTSKK
ncbi:intracellular short-chain-length polyhydroxyalkanoate depolymerase [Senegalia massiliensis]|uniref:Alpha/beta hydrolase n=1 Tax=Senegalia massiliensis TaxID=1720316 RepID=A0A845R0E5_9CLOT|nr:alpha/beta hydrolase [Senegalia massiliensis]NBI07469.1 alpha/beta hydrolase [Senegalia massiliensis]